MYRRFEQFSYVISGIYRYIQKLERDEMIQYGYKGAFAQYLAALSRYPGGLTCAKLCEICDKDKAAVSRMVGEMEEKGLVRRESDNDRLYNARVTLTDEGRAAAEHVCRRAKAAVLAVGSEMSESDRATLYAALDCIAAKLQTLSKEGIPQQDTI